MTKILCIDSRIPGGLTGGLTGGFTGGITGGTRLLLLLLSAAIVGCSVQAANSDVVLTRDKAVGDMFGAPGPRSCASLAQPTSGPPSPAQVRAYVICGYEKRDQGGSDSLYLVAQVKVQVGSGRPYEHVRDSLESIDPRRKVYDIKGTSVTYQCGLPGGVLPRDKLCRRTVNANDTGKCFQTTFGEWRCTWGDLSAPISTDTRLLVGPPSVAEAE